MAHWVGLIRLDAQTSALTPIADDKFEAKPVRWFHDIAKA